MPEFSLNESLLRDILQKAKPFGHNEKPRNLNLGFGFIYYGLVRAIQPHHTIVIGSGYGFSVVCLGLGLRDNGTGRLTFVDPSYSLLKDGPLKTIGGRSQWDDPAKVGEHFASFGVSHIVSHFRLRSEEFFSSYDQLQLPDIDLAFIDGSHAYEDVRHDFLEVLGRSRRNTYIFLHDTNIYIRELVRHAGVKRWLRLIRREEKAFEVIDFPFSSGVALVRVLEPQVWKQLH
jgi:hypothetical protein